MQIEGGSDRRQSGDFAVPPLVSVIMPNYRGAPFLQAAIRSVLAQTYRQIELIVVDDNSQDGSAEILRHEAALDARLKPITLGKNLGPAAARNVALDASSGTWIAVVDSDDLVHPSRIERLLAAADAMNADMIADDLVPFGTPTAAGRTVLGSRADSLPQITAVDLLLSDMGFSGTTSLGYLKPLIRRDCLANLRYDEVLTIGEDFDLCLRLLLGGAVYRLIPDPSYLYRRHSESISHRLSVDALDRRMSAMDRIGKDRVIDRETRHALDRRLRLLGQACRYERLVGQIKGRRAFAALAALVKSPRLALHLLDSLMDRRRRAAHLARSVPETETRPILLVGAGMPAPPDLPATTLRLDVPPPPGLDGGAIDRYLACSLATEHSKGVLELHVVGAAGERALGYLPDPETSRIVHYDDTGHRMPDG
ncbi:glycosyltransferase family 2 protein [Wenxinia marina]|uniref:glycosyltransferase family 2 protein n=1 Tax=Wenxinia marina TaxID=390641 RepID=UPI0012FCA11F|nr:glycosyltransferase family 2 protein [Wenxinia marina]